jgi:hypothetical protein
MTIPAVLFQNSCLGHSRGQQCQHSNKNVDIVADESRLLPGQNDFVVAEQNET